MSCQGNISDINQTFIIEPIFVTGSSETVSACTGVYTNILISCDGDAEIILDNGQTLFNTNIVPIEDATIDLGIVGTRFRNINTVSGTSSVWTSTTRITTPEVDLGLDSLGNLRILTADSSVLNNDVLFGGDY